jgi:hypothetical protein
MEAGMYYLVIILLSMNTVHAWDFFTSPKKPSARAQLHSTPRDGPPPLCLSKQQQQLQNRYPCPHPRELYKQNMRWNTDSGWKGYQNSFSDNISHFMGVQWKGVGVGRVYCMYQPEDSSEFPIQITTTSLIIRPDTAHWENAPHQDSINCISKKNDPCDCQFSIYIEEKEDDLDAIISGIKKK